MIQETKTILIVEDEAFVRFDLVDFFERSGWQVLEADNADHAIAILERHKDVRVVLTDVQMPGSMDGLKLAHFIRNRFPPTALFITSGHERPCSTTLPERATFLPKPFDHYRLLSRIEAVVA
ncbi:response regulator [Qipengyuania spongiae]|uniref:Response regulator n=1 Tax=Qipengyuania spongiae TaxID=2909673 RepID=A0ABY5T0Q3_9SPHN|nr:response regulator [Qipengyuania spongiae]UVI40382.1 response regulator [Qipengyuania spongiae]